MGRNLPADMLKTGPEESLTVIDNRTGRAIEVPIKNNAIQATAFKQLKTDTKDGERKEDDREAGLRVMDGWA
jgi:citrate synthase